MPDEHLVHKQAQLVLYSFCDWQPMQLPQSGSDMLHNCTMERTSVVSDTVITDRGIQQPVLHLIITELRAIDLSIILCLFLYASAIHKQSGYTFGEC